MEHRIVVERIVRQECPEGEFITILKCHECLQSLESYYYNHEDPEELKKLFIEYYPKCMPEEVKCTPPEKIAMPDMPKFVDRLNTVRMKDVAEWSIMLLKLQGELAEEYDWDIEQARLKLIEEMEKYI